VLSDWLIVRASTNPGEGFLDRMISLIEGAKRQKTPNEIALSIFALCIHHHISRGLYRPFAIFHLQCEHQSPGFSRNNYGTGSTVGLPHSDHNRRPVYRPSASPVLDRLIRRNVIALSGRAVEAAGDVDVLLLDKTGTITLGNREAVEFLPVNKITALELAEAAQLASLADETPEGRSIVILAKQKYGLRGTVNPERQDSMQFIPFSATDAHERRGYEWIEYSQRG